MGSGQTGQNFRPQSASVRELARGDELEQQNEGLHNHAAARMAIDHVDADDDHALVDQEKRRLLRSPSMVVGVYASASGKHHC